MSYLDALSQTIDAWNRETIQDEWVFEKLRIAYVRSMTSEQAFESIGPTIDVLLRQPDESTAVEILQTIISLARRSDTTEAPSGFLANRDELTLKMSQYGEYAQSKFQELLTHYRILP